MKALALTACLGLLFLTASAYWADTPLDQLAAESDVVVIGRVTGLLPDTNTLRVKVTLGELMVIKGQVSGDTVSFDAPFTLNHCVRFEMSSEQAHAFLRAAPNPNTVLRPAWSGTNNVEIIGLNSFSTNEHCAVLLKKDLTQQGALQLVRSDDGKFAFNAATMHLHKGVTAGTNAISNAIAFPEFVRIVQASPTPAPITVMATPIYGPFLSLTNMPATLILPRAITR